MKKVIKIFTLFVAMMLISSLGVIYASAEATCTGESVNIASQATVTGDRGPGTVIDVAEDWVGEPFNNGGSYVFWGVWDNYHSAIDGNPNTVCPVDTINNSNVAYGLRITFDGPYNFSKVVIQPYGQGRVESSHSIAEEINRRENGYPMDIYFYDGNGNQIAMETRNAQKENIEIDTSEYEGICQIYIHIKNENVTKAQGIWEVEAWTTETHNWEFQSIKTAPTCTAQGIASVKCSGCGEPADAIANATGHKNSCTGVCANDNCEETVNVEHVRAVNSTDCSNPECGATGVFTLCEHVEDPENPCTGICAICKEPNTVTIQHLSDGSTCNNDCVKCGAENVIPTAYELYAQGKTPFVTSTNTPLSEHFYITHVANPNNPCDTTCNNPNCETYGNNEKVVVNTHVGTACGQTTCQATGCGEPFYGYKNGQYHTRLDPVNPEVSGKYTCGVWCGTCKTSYKNIWGHVYEDCTSNCIYCGAFSPTAKERRHTFTTESPYVCTTKDCGYTNPSLNLCVNGHTYDNICDNKCNDCASIRYGWRSGGFSGEYWHVYTNTCDTTCNDCGEIRTITHTYTANCDELCNVCGENTRVPTVNHTYADVTGTDAQIVVGSGSTCSPVCTACGESRTPPHNLPYVCAPNCATCGLTNANADELHTYDNDCDASCNNEGCFYERDAGHNFDDDCDTTCNNEGCTYTRDFTGHKYKDACDATCDSCGHIRTAETDSTYDPDHSYDNGCDTICNICGAVRTTEHAFDNVCDDTCNNCNLKIRETSHTFGDWSTSKEPTRKTEGEETRKCSGCNTTETRIIPAKGGLGAGAIVAIVVCSVAVVCGGGFSIWWFVFKKKRV